MDNEETKQTTRRIPRVEQVDSDFALAMALQEQERAFTMLPNVESESDQESESESDASDENDYEFFEDDLEFLEGEDSNTDTDMEEDDDIDPDELSYEELIALGEIIGVERRGLSLNEISTCLRPSKFQSVKNKTGIDRCVVCQIEYEEGESLVSLPCLHPYHSECISKWLHVKRVCPICSTEAYP